jgi:hypothetical protein
MSTTPTEYIWESFSELITEEIRNKELRNSEELMSRILYILTNTIRDDDGEDTAPTVVEEAVDRFWSAVEWHKVWELAQKEISCTVVN